MAAIPLEDLHRFSQAVQDVWRLSLTAGPEDFQAEALRLVGRFFSFDACFWGLASLQGSFLQPHHVHLDRVSPEAVLEYEDIRDVDVVAHWVVANPGKTLHFDTRTADPSVPRAVLDFDLRHGIEQLLCTMVVEPVPEVATFLSIYRAPGRPTFTAEERAIVEALAPHLAGAFEACRTRDTGGRLERDTSEGLAAVDRTGRLHSRAARLDRLRREEWTDWSGPDLPGPLRDLCRAGGTFKGKALVASIEPPRSSFSRLFLRRKAPADRLSEREQEMATAYSLGMEAAEIATAMGLSVASVRNRIRQIYATLGVASRVDLVAALAVLTRGPGT